MGESGGSARTRLGFQAPGWEVLRFRTPYLSTTLSTFRLECAGHRRQIRICTQALVLSRPSWGKVAPSPAAHGMGVKSHKAA